MSKDPRVVKTDSVDKPKRKSPMTIILESVGGDYWTMKDVAAHVGVNIETIRRLSRKVDDDGKMLVKAPSYAVQHGGIVIYLFDMDDVVEVENHFIGFGYQLNKRVDKRKKLANQKPEEK